MNYVLVLLATAMMISPCGHAAMDALAEITGYVASFDASTVKLYVNGEFVSVPRKAVAKHARVVVGNEVTAYVETKRTVAGEHK